MQCPRCGADNKETRVACWNCFGQLHQETGGKRREIEVKVPEKPEPETAPPAQETEMPVEQAQQTPAATPPEQESGMPEFGSTFVIPELAEAAAEDQATQPEQEQQPEDEPQSLDFPGAPLFEPDYSNVDLQTEESGELQQEESQSAPQTTEIAGEQTRDEEAEPAVSDSKVFDISDTSSEESAGYVPGLAYSLPEEDEEPQIEYPAAPAPLDLDQFAEEETSEETPDESSDEKQS